MQQTPNDEQTVWCMGGMYVETLVLGRYHINALKIHNVYMTIEYR